MLSERLKQFILGYPGSDRASKHLPSSDDLNVNIKIAGNELLWKMLEDTALAEQFAKEKPERLADKELIKKIYLELANTPEYKNYKSKGAREKSEEKKIIEFILNFDGVLFRITSFSFFLISNFLE